MRYVTRSLAVVLAAGALLVGCNKEAKTEKVSKDTKPVTSEPVVKSMPSTMPTTKPAAVVTAAPDAKVTPPKTPEVKVAPPAKPAVADKDLTHVLTKGESYYSAIPADGAKADGKLKKGDKRGQADISTATTAAPGIAQEFERLGLK